MESYVSLSNHVGISLSLEKLFTQSSQHYREALIQHYQQSDSVLMKGLAASELWQNWQEEKELGAKKITYARMKETNLEVRELRSYALKFERQQLSLNFSESEKALFKQLEFYEGLSQSARQHYKLCADDAKEKGLKTWQSDYYLQLHPIIKERNEEAYHLQTNYSVSERIALANRLEINISKLDEQAHAHEARILCERFKGSDSILEKAMIAQELTDWQDIEPDLKQKITLKAILDAKIDWQSLNKSQKQFETLLFRDQLSPREQSAFDRLSQYCDLKREVGIRFAEVSLEVSHAEKEGNSLKPWQTSAYKEFWESRKEMNAIAASIQEKLLEHHPFFERFNIKENLLDQHAHRHYLQNVSEQLLEDDHRVHYFAAQELVDWLAFDQETKTNDTAAILMQQGLSSKQLQTILAKDNATLPSAKPKIKDDIKNDIRDKTRIASNQKTRSRTHSHIHSPSLSFEEAKERLSNRLPELALSLLGEPTSKSGYQWRYGKKGSLAIFVQGPHKGLVSDFAENRYGSPFFLIENLLNLKGKEALEWAQNWLGEASRVKIERPTPLLESSLDKAWKPLFPVPENAEAIDIENNRFLNFMLKDRVETARYAYKDQDSNLLGYVVRLEDQDGHKITPTLTYCANDTGQHHWRWQGFGKERPLYRLDRLTANPDKPVLVVEGEKTADAAQNLFPDHVVVTWPGGAGAVNKANWNPLKERNVIIWPDADEPGQKAAQKIEDLLHTQGVERVSIAELPPYTPEKWDLADPLPQGWTQNTLQNILNDALGEKILKSDRDHSQNHTSLTQQPLAEDPLKMFQELIAEKESLSFIPKHLEEQQQRHSMLEEQLEPLGHTLKKDPTLFAEKGLEEFHEKEIMTGKNPDVFDTTIRDNEPSKLFEELEPSSHESAFIGKARELGINLPNNLDKHLYTERALEMAASMREWSHVSGVSLSEESIWARACYAQARIADFVQHEFAHQKPTEAYREAEQVALLEANAWFKNFEQQKNPSQDPSHVVHSAQALEAYHNVKTHSLPFLVKEHQKEPPYLPVKWCERIAEQETHLCALLDISTAPQEVNALLIRKAYQIKEQETAIGKLCAQAVTKDPALKDTPSRVEAVQALSKAVEQQLMKTPNSLINKKR